MLSHLEQQFGQEGFVVVRSLFSPEQVRLISAEFDKLHESAESILEAQAQIAADQIACKLQQADPNSTAVAHACVLWSAHGAKYTFNLKPGFDRTRAVTCPSLLDLAVTHIAFAGLESGVLESLGGGCNERLIALATALLGTTALKSLEEESITQIILQAHFKAPGSGVSFPWHQDSKFRREAEGGFVDVTGRGSYVNIATAIDPESDNGPLCLIPGSQKGGHLGGIVGLNPDAVDTSRAICPLLQPGDALCINPWIVHGSEPNQSLQWRRSFITGFAVPSAIQCQATRETESMAWFQPRPIQPNDQEHLSNWEWDAAPDLE